MEQDYQYKAKLQAQLREEYGKVTYTYTCFTKSIQILKNRDKAINIVQIILSALSTVGFVSLWNTDCFWVKFTSTVVSAVLLALTLYTNRFRLSDDIRSFTQGSDELWKIRADYISLLTDMEQLSNEEIVKRRDELIERTDGANRKYPKTSAKSYKKAQKALKSEEEQFFSDDELDMMLPKHLRILQSKRF